MFVGDEHVQLAKNLSREKGYAYMTVGFTTEDDGQFSLVFWKGIKHKRVTYPCDIKKEDLKNLLNNTLDDIEVLFTMDAL